MEIELESKERSKEYYYEIIDGVSQYQKFLKNKNAKLKNTMKELTALMILYVALIALSFALGFFANMSFLIILGCILAIIFFVLIYLVYKYNKTAKILKSEKGITKLIIDENGICTIRPNFQEARLHWDNIQVIRTFKNVTLVYPKEGVFVIFFPNELLNEVKEELAKLGKNDLYIG